MSLLNTNDLIKLSIFRCQKCKKRLRYPIVEIKQFGNVCKDCLDLTTDIDIIYNDELYLVMEKLCFPCNYTEVGCTFFGSFHKVCEHEKECAWREALCPFAYVNKCDTNLCMTEIVSHINEYHNDNILTVEDGYVTVENPSDNNTQCLHMFEVDKNYFLVRSLFDKKSQQILYTFYRMSDNNASRIIRFHSSAFNIQQKNGRLMHESHLRSEFDVTNAFSANLCKLRDLNFDKSVKIIIGNDNTCLKDINGDQVNISEVGFQCQQCLKIFRSIPFCSSCPSFTPNCTTCQENCEECNLKKYSISLSDTNIHTEFVCQSSGCNETLQCQAYSIHVIYHCRFEKKKCLICNTTYTSGNIVEHFLATHKSDINPLICTSQINTITMYAFVNGTDGFIVPCVVSTEMILKVWVVKLTEPFWDSSYTWKLHINFSKDVLELITAGDCSMAGFRREIRLSEFMTDEDSLKFTLQIARV